MADTEKTASDKLSLLIGEVTQALMAASEETDRLTGEAIERGLRSAIRKINDTFDSEIEKLKSRLALPATEEEMFKQVQQEEGLLARQTEVYRQQADFVNSQIMKNRKFSDTLKSSIEASNYQQIQHINYITKLKTKK